MKRRLRWALALVALTALFVALRLMTEPPVPELEPVPEPPPKTVETPKPPAQHTPPPNRPATIARFRNAPAPPVAPVETPADETGDPATSAETEPEACAPEAALVCHKGDVWWVDSCGAPTTELRGCDGAPCVDGECQRHPEAECGDDLALGKCDADKVVTCHGGRLVEVDCAAHEKTCVMTNAEGAVCRKRPAEPCEDQPPRCDGDELIVCVEGGLLHVDCTSSGAQCDAPEGAAPRCLRIEARKEPPEEPDCPCGCDEPAPVGTDIEVKIIAFVIGESWDQAAVTNEINMVNALFGAVGGPTGLRFTLAETLAVDRPQWLNPDNAAIQEMAFSPDLHPERPFMYVPMVFARVIHSGLVPKYGTATLPTRDTLDKGVVVVSKERHWTTGAHEIGHFLGLRHTHYGGERVVTRLEWPGGSAECDGCSDTGDGMCDTPHDPGRAVCSYMVPSCESVCDGFAPDVTNLMSYYHECRRRFSADQIARMRAIVAVRTNF